MAVGYIQQHHLTTERRSAMIIRIGYSNKTWRGKLTNFVADHPKIGQAHGKSSLPTLERLTEDF
jgi:hypothetical protein